MEPLRILFVSAEAVPFVKVGGLADVAGSLPKSLRALPEAPDVRLGFTFLWTNRPWGIGFRRSR